MYSCVVTIDILGFMYDYLRSTFKISIKRMVDDNLKYELFSKITEVHSLNLFVLTVNEIKPIRNCLGINKRIYFLILLK